jgi:hypothetical protein
MEKGISVRIFETKGDEELFRKQLEIPGSQITGIVLIFLLSGVPIGIAAGMMVYTVSAASIGFFAALLGASVSLGGPIGVGAVVALIAGIGVNIGFRKLTGSKSITPKVKIGGPIDVVGAYIAKIVFAPLIGFAAADNKPTEKEIKFIISAMREWGYSPGYIDNMILEYSNDVHVTKESIEKFYNQIRAIEQKRTPIAIQYKKVFSGKRMKILTQKAIDLCEKLRNENGYAGIPEQEDYRSWLSKLMG